MPLHNRSEPLDAVFATMSSQSAAPVAQQSAPVASDPPHPDAANAPTAFGSSLLSKKDFASNDAVDQQSAQADAPAHPSESDADAAAVAAAAAAAAAADASSAAQTITQLATAATNAAASSSASNTTTADAVAPNGSTEHPTAEAPVAAAAAADTANDASAAPDATSTAAADKIDDSAAAPPANADAAAASSSNLDAPDADPKAAEAQAEPESISGLPRNVESELRDIYSVSSAIANFCVAHVNQVNVPTPQKVRSIIQKALKLTSSLSMLLAQPEVALRQLDADENGKRPAESKLDSARKRQRSSDWDGNRVAGSGPSTPAHGVAPLTPHSGLRVFPDGSLPTSFPSPGFDGDSKGPQYKKRSRAPAPGSCQACGSSETPEWRRGPDGARTLCNACGLHYAKLVRKRMQQEGADEPSPSQPPPQVSLVSLDELRASTKSAEAAAAGGMTSSASSSSLNGTPLKVDRAAVWNTPSKPPRVPSSLGSSVIAPELEAMDKAEGAAVAQEAAADAGAVVPPPASASAQASQSGGVEPATTPAAAEPVIAPELAAEQAHNVHNADERPMDTDQ